MHKCCREEGIKQGRKRKERGQRQDRRKKERKRKKKAVFSQLIRSLSSTFFCFPTSHHYNQTSIISINQTGNSALLHDVIPVFTFSMPYMFILTAATLVTTDWTPHHFILTILAVPNIVQHCGGRTRTFSEILQLHTANSLSYLLLLLLKTLRRLLLITHTQTATIANMYTCPSHTHK